MNVWEKRKSGTKRKTFRCVWNKKFSVCAMRHRCQRPVPNPGNNPCQPALENGRSSGFSSLTRLPANQKCSGFQWVRKRWSHSSGYCERFTRSSLLASCRETGGTVSERKSRGFLWIGKWAKTFFWKFPFPLGCPTRRRNVTSPSFFLINF